MMLKCISHCWRECKVVWLLCKTGAFSNSYTWITLKMKVKMKSLSRVWLFATPCTIAYQAPLSMGFSRQEYWSRLPFPSPGHLPNPGTEPRSPTLQADTLPSEPPPYDPAIPPPNNIWLRSCEVLWLILFWLCTAELWIWQRSAERWQVKSLAWRSSPRFLALVMEWMRVLPIKMGKTGERRDFERECNSGIFFWVVKLEIAVKGC